MSATKSYFQAYSTPKTWVLVLFVVLAVGLTYQAGRTTGYSIGYKKGMAVENQFVLDHNAKEINDALSDAFTTGCLIASTNLPDKPGTDPAKWPVKAAETCKKQVGVPTYTLVTDLSTTTDSN